MRRPKWPGFSCNFQFYGNIVISLGWIILSWVPKSLAEPTYKKNCLLRLETNFCKWIIKHHSEGSLFYPLVARQVVATEKPFCLYKFYEIRSFENGFCCLKKKKKKKENHWYKTFPWKENVLSVCVCLCVLVSVCLCLCVVLKTVGRGTENWECEYFWQSPHPEERK